MDQLRRGKKEDGGNYDKTMVLQAAKQIFTANSAKTKDLVEVLTQCIHVILQGQQLTRKEATDLFFHLTRLFQYKERDNTLKRLMYVTIKALSQQADNVHVVTASLQQDANSSSYHPAVRASALRALCQISDPSTYTLIERYLKQSIVDRHPVVASAALTSLIRIFQVNSEIVRRCTNEIQEALKSDSPMVQYHALALLYTMHKSDRSSVSTLLTTCINQGLKSPIAICLLIRLLQDYLNECPDKSDTLDYIAFIRDCMDHRSEMVEYEASRAITTMTKEDDSKVQKKTATLAISHLRNLLSAHNVALRFAALRLLNELAPTSSADVRYWSVHRIGTLCKLHLLNRRLRPGDEIIGVLEFLDSSVVCAKYTCLLQCEEVDLLETKHEFGIGLKQNDFVIIIPKSRDFDAYQPGSIVHAILSFLFYITDKNYPKALYEDKAGTIELGPSELETKLFSCDFPIAVYV